MVLEDSVTPKKFLPFYLLFSLLISSIGPVPVHAVVRVVRMPTAKTTPFARVPGSLSQTKIPTNPIVTAAPLPTFSVGPMLNPQPQLIPQPSARAVSSEQGSVAQTAHRRSVRVAVGNSAATLQRWSEPSGPLAPLKRQRGSGVAKRLALNHLFDSSIQRPSTAGAVVASARPRQALLANQPESFTDELLAEPQIPGPVPEVQPELPDAFRFFVLGKALFGAGQQASTILIPVFAYIHGGPGFAALVMAGRLAAAIPGSLLGGKIVRIFGSKFTYIALTAANAAAFLAVPALMTTTGAFPLLPFVGFVLIDGFAYGALRGVAEKRIATSILGRHNRPLLERGGSVMFFAYRIAEIASAALTAGLVLIWGETAAAALLATVMLVAVAPFSLLRRRYPSSQEPDETPSSTARIPLPLYLPYVFAVFMYLTMYEMLAPFFAMEVFGSKSFTGLLLAAYALGGVVMAGVWSWRSALPSPIAWLFKRSAKYWAVAAALLTSLFLWSTLLLANIPLALTLAAALGAALTANEILWRAIYQHRLDSASQLDVFKWLGVWSSALAIVPLLLLEGGHLLLPAVAIKTLLLWVAGGITAVSLSVPLALVWWRRSGH
jgi:hypothetical protein